ncbi:hypothetical protein HID58_013403 [Brassica napus]|uniref:Uncharacterized protein n=1 Tax=Brassica napus TaxID=3708 RepID=A0ABQ8E3S3_BRANA|nr:hypothetical protein HID58_013403 [Brassica napus]
MDDLFSAYMNLENIDALNSPEADMESTASITRVVAIITIALQECFSRHFLCHACSGSELAYLRV